MTDLKALLESVEKAEGPDHNGLDRDLHEALTGQCTHGETRYYCVEDGNDSDSGFECVKCGKDLYGESWPAYTASIDAAVALVEKVLPGWGWYARKDSEGSYGQGCFGGLTYPKHNSVTPGSATCATPALALCAALLKALIAKEAQP